MVLRAIYGMFVELLLWYHNFSKDKNSIGSMFNNHDPCVENRTVNEIQHTVWFHVDDILSSHVNHKANNKLLKRLNLNYGKLKTIFCESKKGTWVLGNDAGFYFEG